MLAQILETPVDHGGSMVSLVAGEGSAAHPWLISADLNVGVSATRNVADMVHLFSMLHGKVPGLVEIAADQNCWIGANSFLGDAVMGFAAERAYFTRLIAAAGPAPSTPGDSNTVCAIRSQYYSLVTLARSERFGCAIGAVVALILDWQSIRSVLDVAADRLGVDVPECQLPDEDACRELLMALPDRPRLDRTLSFGARQLLTHHTGLFDYLQVRAEARGE